ncbi:hypothetical protein VITFI_CDS1534 [Vitreoscilla filiformis]|uniref:Virion morphogenesis protein n=1 Tax=Vitreoscilla filiformis TaxID=63 RepID=A0A221KA83_VITFI|nr:phage virion morphogenesis protein [Vitreoscilla filiformis]ASM75889.1 hypothetical protein VITFI_CDS0110 [Vitreoscilla filiformis]ASM76437.1 hypothetical protein VITFI_CDS0658 [Vitreoscilla filiformis]ASM76838.1 hypothetical protein VITFI_CDS1060 [Vitreoscilla filiformis]ASM77312.1 hypothetical protein VITFI_CDS1534 [Vitreoscilla filiformis]
MSNDAGLVGDLIGEERLLALLRQAVQRLDNLQPMLENIGADWEGRIRERFSTKQAPDGSAWTGLSPATQKRYDAEDKGRSQGTLLERTGTMRDSLASQVDNRDKTAPTLEVLMSRRSHGGKTGPLGGEWSIPLLHEYGTHRMPRRGLFTADPEQGELAPVDRDAISDEVAHWLAASFTNPT